MQRPGRTLAKEQLKKIIKVARGELSASLKIINANILDLINGGSFEASLVLCDDYIAGVGLECTDFPAEKTIDAMGMTLVPGFIDGHLHIESSMVHPFEFEKMTLPLGTTSLVCDPHELTNVMGKEGIAWFLRCSEITMQNLFVQMSSCVPAVKELETNGAEFTLSEMREFKHHPHVLGLAEMMNFVGVINGDDEVLDKICEFQESNLDGHSPLLRGNDLNAYIAAGIQNCHETVGREEAMEKLQKGMSIILREGSVAKNLKNLAPIVNEFNSTQCLLCTDDRNPFEILKEGHINFMVHKLINEINVPVHVAYRLATFSAAKHFGLKRLGLLAPGRMADILFISDLKEVRIEKVLKSGQVIDKNFDYKSEEKLALSMPPLQNTIQRKQLSVDQFRYNLNDGFYNVIQIIEDEIITQHLVTERKEGKFLLDDVLMIANIERYGHELAPALGLVKGLKLAKGAMASTVAHDSHNIIVVGTTIEDMVLAANTLIDSSGGQCVVCDQKVLAHLELPIGGLLSDRDHLYVKKKIEDLKVAYKSLGVQIEEPFIQLAFLALPVIPEIKLTDKGLFKLSEFRYLNLKAEEK